MKKRLMLFLALVLTLGLVMPVFAAPPKAKSTSKEHRYYGDISDSNCGAHHPIPDARKCTLECVKKGAKYVFVYRGKVLAIANQADPNLEKYAGEHVRITGTRSHDTITIASMVHVKPRPRKKKAAN